MQYIILVEKNQPPHQIKILQTNHFTSSYQMCRSNEDPSLLDGLYTKRKVKIIIINVPLLRSFDCIQYYL